MRDLPVSLAKRRPGRLAATVGAAWSAELQGSAPGPVDAQRDRVRADRVGALCLELVDARVGERERGAAVGGGGGAVDGRAGGDGAVLAVGHADAERDAGGGVGGAGEPEHVRLAEGVEDPEHLVAVVHAGGAAAGLGELVVDDEAPELGGVGGVAGDLLDGEVAERGKPVGVPGEAVEAGAVVESGGGGRHGRGEGPGVGAVAGLRAAGRGGRDGVPVGRDGAVEDRLGGALHAQVDGDGRGTCCGRCDGGDGEGDGKRPPDRFGHVATLSSRVVWRTTGARSPGLGLRATPSRGP